MAKNTFAFFGFIAVLLLGIGFTIAASGTTTSNGITMTVNETSLTDVTTGETYSFEVTLENNNGTDYNVSFGTSGWTWDKTGETVANGTTETFIGILTIGTTQSKSVIAKFYNMSNSSQVLFQISKTVSLSYVDVLGCTDDTANNYNENATLDDDSCTFDEEEEENNNDYNFCEINGKIGDLKIADVEFTNLGEGEDDDWFLLDEIEIEVEIENTHNTENVRDVLVEIMILDNDDNDVTNDFDFEDEEINLNTIKDDDSEYVTFKIKEIPADLDSGWYNVYIKAYSEDDEDTQCVAEAGSKYLDHLLYQRIEVTREEDPAIVVKEDILSISASCGDNNVALPLNIYNLGSDKEEKVLVTVYNSALGLNEKIIIDNLKSGKRKEITFYFDVPQDLSGSAYTLDIITYYDYDDDEEEMEELSYSENSEDDLDKDFSVRLDILSCRGAEPTINANLDSAAEIGTNLVIKAIITNNGNDNDFVISVSDFESWADLVSVSPQTASIDEGEFIEVTITLSPKVAGTQSFKINTIADGESYDQSVSVSIAEKPGIFGGISDVVTYIIIAIIAIIVLIFLVLIAKISRKSAKPQF